MRNKFFKKIFVSLILIAMLGVISVGCGTVAPPIPIIPTTCTLIVYSQNFNVWGYVWVNGLSTGQWIDFNGAVTVTGLTPGTVASVQVVDNWGASSHVEFVTLGSGTNTIVFYWW